MTHIRNKAKEFVELVNRTGFNGVPVTANLELGFTREEVVPSEMTDAGYDEWLRDYAIFTFEPDFFSLTYHINRAAENKYVDVSVDVNEAGFWRDVTDALRMEFGDGVTIQRHEGCNELEIIRPKAAETDANPGPSAA